MGEAEGTGRPDRLGRYRLIRKIAVGGMAEIYLARMTGLGGFEKNVVLKRILPQLAEEEEFFRMFVDEARIAATLQHPNVIQVYDAGHEGGQYFIAMEHLEGADLLSVLRSLSRQGRVMPLEHALHIASGIAAGLHYAHEKVGLDGTPLDIVHRDVTPHNVFVTRDGGVKLVDFGIAKATNRISHTTYGALKGKLSYMSPEQCQCEPVDRRSDIYSLGIVLYEMTTGVTLYSEHSDYQVLREIVEGEVAPPSTVRGDFPLELEGIIMRALEKDPDRRFADARELERAILQFSRAGLLALSPLAMSDWLRPILDESRAHARRRQEERASFERESFEGAKGRAEEPGYVSPDIGDETLSSSVDMLIAELTPPPAPIPPVAGGADGEGAAPASGPTKVLSARSPPPEGLHVPVELEECDVRAGRTLTWLVAGALLAGAAAVLWILVNQPGRDARAKAGPQRAAPDKELGKAIVESDPEGAEAWLLLGRTPVESMPIPSGRAQWLLIDRDGYGTERVEVTSRAWEGSGDGRRAEIKVELEPLKPGGEASRNGGGTRNRRAGVRADREADGAAVSAPAPGVLRVVTNPPAAQVWLKVGETPVIVDLAIDRSHAVRLDLEGYAPSFVDFEPSDFGDSGRAHVRAGMSRVSD